MKLFKANLSDDLKATRMTAAYRAANLSAKLSKVIELGEGLLAHDANIVGESREGRYDSDIVLESLVGMDLLLDKIDAVLRGMFRSLIVAKIDGELRPSIPSIPSGSLVGRYSRSKIQKTLIDLSDHVAAMKTVDRKARKFLNLGDGKQLLEQVLYLKLLIRVVRKMIIPKYRLKIIQIIG